MDAGAHSLSERRRPAGPLDPGSSRAFTLIEVLFAVAIGAMILVAATTFLFSMAELWGAGSNERLFKKHARGVSRFLEQSFASAATRYTEPGGQPGQPGVDAPAQPGSDAETPVYWFGWDSDDSARAQFLTFELEKGPGALVWPSEPLPHVVCSLDFDSRNGLFLLWRSRLEEDFEDEAPRRTLISPFVKQMRYHYLDAEAETPTWEILEQPKINADQSYVLPQRVEIVFEGKSGRVARQLVLPNPMSGVPIL